MVPSVRAAGGLDDRKGWLRGLVRSFVHGDGFEVAVRAVVGAGDGRGIVVQAIDGRGGHGGLGFVRAVVGRGRPAQDSLMVLEDGLDAPSVLRLAGDDERGLASSSGGDELEECRPRAWTTLGHDLRRRSARATTVVWSPRPDDLGGHRADTGAFPFAISCETSLDVESGEGREARARIVRFRGR